MVRDDSLGNSDKHQPPSTAHLSRRARGLKGSGSSVLLVESGFNDRPPSLNESSGSLRQATLRIEAVAPRPLAAGELRINIQAALTLRDGSETLEFIDGGVIRADDFW